MTAENCVTPFDGDMYVKNWMSEDMLCNICALFCNKSHCADVPRLCVMLYI